MVAGNDDKTELTVKVTDPVAGYICESSLIDNKFSFIWCKEAVYFVRSDTGHFPFVRHYVLGCGWSCFVSCKSEEKSSLVFDWVWHCWKMS